MTNKEVWVEATGHYRDDSGRVKSTRASANRQELMMRRTKALEMRLEGHSYRAIADKLGVNQRTVRHDLDTLLQERDKLLIPQYRAIEEKRLDDALVAAYEVLEANRGTELGLKAVDRILRVSHRRSGLLGLDAPIELNVNTIEKTQADLELEELVREAQARNTQIEESIRAGDDSPV